MKYFDLVDFDTSSLQFPSNFYGFDRIFTTNEISITSKPTVKAKILEGNADMLLKYYRKFDILHIPSYEYSLELFAKAKEQDKAFLVSISQILYNPFIMYRIKNFIKVARHYNLKLVFASLARDEYSIRSVEEAASILSYCGLTRDQVRHGYSLLEKYVKQE
jgi:hypothetical protein